MNTFKQKVIGKVEEICQLMNHFIENDRLQGKELSLFEGQPGAVLFFYQYAQFNPQKKNDCYDKINH